jgi:hypothetical protein
MTILDEAKKLVEYHSQFQDQVSVTTSETIEELLQANQTLSEFAVKSKITIDKFLGELKSIDLKIVSRAPMMHKTLLEVLEKVHIEDEELKERIEVLVK